MNLKVLRSIRKIHFQKSTNPLKKYTNKQVVKSYINQSEKIILIKLLI